MALALPPIISAGAARDVEGAVWCDVRWYLDGSDGHDAYLASHIDGAIFVDLDRHLATPPTRTAGRHPLPTAAAFAASLAELGIGPNSPVIAYDDRQGVPAGRLAWMLRAIGHEAALLDGGLDCWTGATASGQTVLPPTRYPAFSWPDVLADADATASYAEDENCVVIDARAPERFNGHVEPIDSRAGHIPGAINIPFGGNLDAEGRFLSKADLLSRFTAARVDSAAVVVNYCGSGVSACHNLLAMEHAGLPTARLYPGSWSAWSGDQTRPIATET